MTTQTLVQGSDAGRWEQAIYAFLAEKERRSGSMRTVRAYSGMLYRFFGNVGKQPDQVTSPEVFGYAHGIGLSGKEPSSVTINARIACLSSFYRFLIRMSLVSANPCDQLERPRATPAPPRSLTAADIKKLLDFIPDNPVGLRDRAIILTLILTGRRRAESASLKRPTWSRTLSTPRRCSASATERTACTTPVGARSRSTAASSARSLATACSGLKTRIPTSSSEGGGTARSAQSPASCGCRTAATGCSTKRTTALRGGY